MKETAPPVVVTRALSMRTLRRHQWHYPSARSMYEDQHSWTTRHGATSGRTAISIPKIPSSQITENTDSSPENGSPKFRGSKDCGNRSAHLGPACCAYRGRRRSRTWQSNRDAPQASPLVYTAREKDPR